MNLTPGFALLLLQFGCYLIQETEAEPILPKAYAQELGFGFATNWFKSFPPLSKYKPQNIIDVYQAGFRNLRLRCRADLYYNHEPFDDSKFRSFLKDLEKVVDDCIAGGVYPVISWIHHDAEAYATDEDMANYITWWRKVAMKLKDKDHRLSFNLFTELGIDECKKTGNCDGSLKRDIEKYTKWTTKVVKAIRGTGGNNADRILILGSPQKTAKGMSLIDKTIYEGDNYMMAEFHIYASGPNKIEASPKYWVGDGTPTQRQTLLDEINTAKADIPLELYFGAWMPQDNIDGSLNQAEVESFAKYFVSVMKSENIPTGLNVLDVYYNTKAAEWVTTPLPNSAEPLNMAKVLEVIQENM